MIIAMVLCYVIAIFALLSAVIAFGECHNAERYAEMVNEEASRAFLILNERIAVLESGDKVKRIR